MAEMNIGASLHALAKDATALVKENARLQKQVDSLQARIEKLSAKLESKTERRTRTKSTMGATKVSTKTSTKTKKASPAKGTRLTMSDIVSRKHAVAKPKSKSKSVRPAQKPIHKAKAKKAHTSRTVVPFTM